MSGPDSPSDPEYERDAEDERSSSEEVLEHEADLQQEAEMKREGPGSESRSAEPESEEQRAEEDAEQVESEWHTWILAAVVVIGIALVFAPRFFLPELLGTLGAILVAVGVLGWSIKWAIERSGQ